MRFALAAVWIALMAGVEGRRKGGRPARRHLPPTNSRKGGARGPGAGVAPVEVELEAMDAKQLKAMLREIYAAHNPERLDAVDDLCAEYAGNEAVLLAAVREKYGIVPQQNFSLEVPRVTAKQLAERPDLLAGTIPFVLLGEANRWPAAQRWAALEGLAAMIPSETVDFYPTNYNSTFGKLNRTLMTMPEAVTAFRGPETRRHREDWEDARYMQIRLTSEGWDALRHDLLPLPQSFWTVK